MHLCVVGTISFSVESKHNGDSQDDSDEDQDTDQIPFYKKSLSELSDKFGDEKAGKFIIMESFMINIHKPSSFICKSVATLHSKHIYKCVFHVSVRIVLFQD